MIRILPIIILCFHFFDSFSQRGFIQIGRTQGVWESSRFEIESNDTIDGVAHFVGTKINSDYSFYMNVLAGIESNSPFYWHLSGGMMLYNLNNTKKYADYTLNGFFSEVNGAESQQTYSYSYR